MNNHATYINQNLPLFLNHLKFRDNEKFPTNGKI